MSVHKRYTVEVDDTGQVTVSWPVGDHTAAAILIHNGTAAYALVGTLESIKAGLR